MQSHPLIITQQTGRFLVMHTNDTPHLSHDINLKTGGGLKDGWSYLMPTDEIMLYEEVTSAFADEHEKHVMEQVGALKNLYLSHHRTGSLLLRKTSEIPEEEDAGEGNEGATISKCEMTFVVKRGLQVVGCVSFDEAKGVLSDLAIRPSAKEGNVESELILAVRKHAIKSGLEEIVVMVNDENQQFFVGQGFMPWDNGERMFKLSLVESRL